MCETRMGLTLALALTSSALLFAGALIFVAYFKLYRRCSLPCCGQIPLNGDGDERRPTNTHVVEPPAEPAVRRFDWSEIDSATGGFPPEAVIGEGGFCTVYLARLPDSSLAAVKIHRSTNSSERLRRAFRHELDALLRARHPNIVRLLGYCDDHDELAMVFEYVPNGTLHHILHSGDGEVLPWARRMSIALRLAGAVDYLHESCDPQIVHGDITAANVLLDRRLDPKLCDFGSVRAGFFEAVRPPAGLMVGSPGYADPHYLRTGIVSKKSDVYNFGVLLLELITGMPAFRPEEGRLLAAEAVDPRLGGVYDAAEAVVVASIAALCMGDQPSLRPAMAEVIGIMKEKVPSSTSAVQRKCSSETASP